MAQNTALNDDANSVTAPRFAIPEPSWYPVIVTVFASLLVISNIGAVKLISFGPLITDGGVFLFPLVYIVGDVLSEVYGWKAARRAIWLGMAMSLLAALTFYLVQISPPADDWGNQEAWEAVLGFVPRIVAASLLGFLVGQLLNAYVLVRLKERMAERRMWARLLGSSVVGQFADTLVFCTVAFYGIITGAEFLNYLIVGFLYKLAVEFLLLPVTYVVINVVKRNEPRYYGESELLPAS